MWAIVLRIWPDKPVYHAYGRIEREGDKSFDVTKCGRKVDLYVPWLPLKHAVKFARPCKGCYPE